MDSTTGTQAGAQAAPVAQPLAVGRGTVDLRRQEEVEDWMLRERPQAVFAAAATVGGILANDTRPAEFLYDNLAIEANIIHGAHLAGVEKLMLLGSSCIRRPADRRALPAVWRWGGARGHRCATGWSGHAPGGTRDNPPDPACREFMACDAGPNRGRQALPGAAMTDGGNLPSIED